MRAQQHVISLNGLGEADGDVAGQRAGRLRGRPWGWGIAGNSADGWLRAGHGTVEKFSLLQRISKHSDDHSNIYIYGPSTNGAAE